MKLNELANKARLARVSFFQVIFRAGGGFRNHPLQGHLAHEITCGSKVRGGEALYMLLSGKTNRFTAPDPVCPRILVYSVKYDSK